VKWKTVNGVDREERVDLKERLPKTIDTGRHPGQLFVQDPLTRPPILRVEVQDMDLQVTFEATVRYEGELLPDGARRLRHLMIKQDLYRSSGDRAR
jgi:hypothetical protein